MSVSQGELEHRQVKRFYARTNKNAAVGQITRLERRERAMTRIKRRKEKAVIPQETHTGRKNKKIRAHIDFLESESLPYTAPELHHHISKSRNFPMNIMGFLSDNQGDPAIVVRLSFFVYLFG